MSFPSLQDMIVSRVYASIHHDEKWREQATAVSRWVLAIDYRCQWYHCGWYRDRRLGENKIRVLSAMKPETRVLNIFSSSK